LQCKIKYPEDLSDEATDLLKKILVPNPKKRITIPEIKKHPFYLKGKKNFENNFTICQVSPDDTSNSDNSFSINYITADSNSFLKVNHYKTEIKLNKNTDKHYKYFNLNLKRKRNYSLQIKVKKNIDFGKEIKKMGKELKERKIANNKDINEERKLIYNHSFNLKIIEMSTFCESLINRNKEEERKNIDKKLIKNNAINNIKQNKNKIEQNSKNIKKEEIRDKYLNLKHIMMIHTDFQEHLYL
jgi:serine/threonine protein kinase